MNVVLERNAKENDVDSEQIKTAVRDALQEEHANAEREPLRTHEDLKALSVEEVNERWPEVSAVLQGKVPTDDAGEGDAE